MALPPPAKRAPPLTPAICARLCRSAAAPSERWLQPLRDSHLCSRRLPPSQLKLLPAGDLDLDPRACGGGAVLRLPGSRSAALMSAGAPSIVLRR